MKISLLSIIAGWAMYGMLFALAPLVDTHTGIGLLVQALCSGIVGLVIYLGLSKIVKLEEARL